MVKQYLLQNNESETIMYLTPLQLKTLAEVCIDAKIFNAAIDYLNLQTRAKNPKGTFDNAKRFSLDEYFDCCGGIRSPSRNHPYSEMCHGRSAIHVASQHDIPHHASLVKRYAMLMNKHPILKGSYAIGHSILSAAAAQKALKSFSSGRP